MIVEQIGKQIWRGKEKSIYAAREANKAFIGVDRQLLKQAKKYEVSVVMIVNKTYNTAYFCYLDDFFNKDVNKNKVDWRQRAQLLLPIDFFASRKLQNPFAMVST